MAHIDRPRHLHPDRPFIFQQLEFEEAFPLDLSTAIEQFFGDVQAAAQTIAPLIAVIGFIGLGVMYVGSSWPIVGDWKGRPPSFVLNMSLMFCVSRPPDQLDNAVFTMQFQTLLAGSLKDERVVTVIACQAYFGKKFCLRCFDRQPCALVHHFDDFRCEVMNHNPRLKPPFYG